MRILVFGDSIAQGFFDSRGGWVQRISNEYMVSKIADLKNKRQSPFLAFFNLAISGDRSDSILRRMDNEIEARKWPDESFTLIFAVGTNNSYIQNGTPYSTPEQFEADVLKIIAKAKEFTTRIAFVGLSNCDESLTNPVDWDDIIWTNDRITTFDAVLKECCQAENVTFVPVFEKFSAEQAKRNLLADGVHPNDDGNAFIADLVRPELSKLIVS